MVKKNRLKPEFINTNNTDGNKFVGIKGVLVNVRIDSYRGKIIASTEFSSEESVKSADLTSEECVKTIDLTAGVVGKHAVYFEFLSSEDGVVASFDRFTFD